MVMLDWILTCCALGGGLNSTDYNTEVPDSTRAQISMVHDNPALTVSQDEAKRVEEDAKRRLLASRRLSLVVDLDQTIIHATVDPTVAEWQEDKDNPNHDAVKDVRSFQLVDDGPGMRGCWYYIKLRPGLEEFLKKISTLFELHIYTMGTRAYAQNVANIVDPDRKIFGDRILSRDESGSLTAKNLQRLFPVDTKMVVIIDDRGDVWKWSDNLIRVLPYDFFVGIGDINSSFLPKKQELKNALKSGTKAKKPAPAPAPTAETQTAKPGANGSANEGAKDNAKGGPGTEVSALEQLVTMGGGDNPVLLQEQACQQEEAIAHQVEERPLLQKQKLLDAEDDASEITMHMENGDSSSDDSQDSSKHRHHLLEDNDKELHHLEERLCVIHHRFFDEYDRRRTQSLGGRISALRGERIAPKDKGGVDLRIVPDVKVILPDFKRKVLGGVVMVFSGVLPLGTDTQNADISLWAKGFGAVITSKIGSRTTHLVAGRNRTAKVREATRYPKVKIVTVQWLVDSLIQWKHMDEDPYLLPVHPDDQGEPIGSGEDTPDKEESFGKDLVSSEDETVSMSDDNESGLGDADEEIRLSTGLDENSRLGIDEDEQDEIDDELKAFLGSDNEDSESDSDASFLGTPTATKTLSIDRKRKRDTDSEGTTDDEHGPNEQLLSTLNQTPASRLSQKIKRSHERSTGLKAVESSSPGVGSIPSNSDEMEAGKQVLVGEEPINEGEPDPVVNDPEDEEDLLEQEMLAALEDGSWDERGPEDEASANG